LRSRHRVRPHEVACGLRRHGPRRADAIPARGPAYLRAAPADGKSRVSRPAAGGMEARSATTGKLDRTRMSRGRPRARSHFGHVLPGRTDISAILAITAAFVLRPANPGCPKGQASWQKLSGRTISAFFGGLHYPWRTRGSATPDEPSAVDDAPGAGRYRRRA